MHFWTWLAFVGGFIVLEILSLSLVFLSLAIAALAGAIGAALWSGTYLQWIFFGLTALLTLFFVRPLARRYLFKKKYRFSYRNGCLDLCFSAHSHPGKFSIGENSFARGNLERTH